ncbi:MAG: RimK/LysX family protein, partial [Bacteroidota bacterium]
LFGEKHEVEFTLADRTQMECPVLLGRKFLQEKYVVDVSKFNLSAKQKPRKKQKSKRSGDPAKTGNQKKKKDKQ